MLCKVLKLTALGLFLLILPLLGVLLDGKSIATYLEFPPLAGYVSHAPFSWQVFTVLAFVIFTVCFPFVWKIILYQKKAGKPSGNIHSFPVWGWLGISLAGLFWILAWNRYSWFAVFQSYTFFPLWLSFIITVNGVTKYRCGTCMLLEQSRYFFLLFPLSSCFWWFFEYLNRFVQNWHYLGVEEFSSLGYTIHASLCFSTVLPAVLSTEELLATFPNISKPLERAYPAHIKDPRIMSWSILVLTAFGLTGISIWPDYLFPLLWISPLLIILSVQALCKRKTILAPLAKGDWRSVWIPALAALICGFFWEMWNFKSLAHWEYSVPFVNDFLLFEMPLLGYAGYLPFGLECKVAGTLLAE